MTRKQPKPILAIAVPISGNSKTGPVAVTSVSQVSCADGCPFLGSGCYAESGHQAYTTRRLNLAEGTHLQAAETEAAGIDRLPGWNPLRLHAVGDCKDNQTAQLVSSAADRYRDRGNDTPVWTYTHAWPNVERKSWGRVSVLASCERPEQLTAADERGYATALVVADLPAGPVDLPGGFRGIPCPEQAGRAPNCLSCKLCWQGDRLRDTKRTILFQPHGARKGAAKAHVTNVC